MAQVLTIQSLLHCAHGGLVGLEPSQDWVRILDVPVLVEPGLLDRPIRACPHATPSTPPCTQTVAVDPAPSYSEFVRIDGRALCKSTAIGRTNWSKLGVVQFSVDDARQDWVGIMI